MTIGVPITAAATASAIPLVAATAKMVATTDLSGKNASTNAVEKMDNIVNTKTVCISVANIIEDGIKIFCLCLDEIYAK